MEWIASLITAIDYIEEHLLEFPVAKDMAEKVSRHINMSSFSFQKRFRLLTGYSFGEYLKNRKLYEAACEFSKSDVKVLDIALKYGYESSESFTKAFKRFHGISPTMARHRENPIQQFLPLKINYSIQGGQQLDYYREKMEAFTLIGFEEEFSFPSSYSNIPKFCKELNRKYFNNPENEYQWAIKNYNIGEYGAIIHDTTKGSFRYMVAGMYHGGEVPEGLNLQTFEATEWLKFTCTGTNPNAIQRLNTQIFSDWRFKHPEFKLGAYNIEWYSNGDCKSANYESGIWVPLRNNVKEK